MNFGLVDSLTLARKLLEYCSCAECHNVRAQSELRVDSGTRLDSTRLLTVPTRYVRFPTTYAYTVLLLVK